MADNASKRPLASTGETTSDTRRRTYLIQDPYDLDAIEFIRTIWSCFGLRPVCLYTDPKARFYGERQFPLLRGDAVEDRIDIGDRDLGSVCEELQEKYDVLAVVPYREDTVELAAELCDLLDLGWNSKATLQRFRDKSELKRHVIEQDPSVRVPSYRRVETIEDVWREAPPAKFVIKPNDGLGNQRIGIFSSDEREAIAAHVQSTPPTTWILEEFIGGPEYHVDGQVRSNGEVTILAVFEYTRVSVNGYETVYSGEQQCHTDHQHFEQATAYARRLLEATGLRRCPFHLEVKIDDQGPCLIDLGARFASDGGSRILSQLHPGRPDVFSVAAHDYLGENDFAMDPVDFSHYDSERSVIAFGVSETDGTITSVQGVAAIEAMVEFVGWVVKPAVGDQLTVTKELRGAPYIVELRHHGSQADSDRLIGVVQETVTWNQSGQSYKDRLVLAEQALQKAARKAQWLLSRRL